MHMLNPGTACLFEIVQLDFIRIHVSQFRSRRDFSEELVMRVGGRFGLGRIYLHLNEPGWLHTADRHAQIYYVMKLFALLNLGKQL